MNILLAGFLIIVAYYIGKLAGYHAGEQSVKDLHYFIYKPELKIHDIGYRKGKEEGIHIGRCMQINEDMRRDNNDKKKTR